MRRIVHPKLIERGYAVDCGRVRLKMKLDFFSREKVLVLGMKAMVVGVAN